MRAELRLALTNRPENVLVVRQALTGLAGALALDAIETNDLNTAVTEACNNVVMHAYAGAEGPLEVDVQVRARVLCVVVRDRGIGMQEPYVGGGTGARDTLGLAVIDALSSCVGFACPCGGGTELRMEFPLPSDVALAEYGDARGRAAAGEALLTRAVLVGALELRIAPSTLARAILPRVLSALAARAHFSTDRISDVQILADALAANAGASVLAGELALGVTVTPRNLTLRIGPLPAGHAQSLVLAGADGLAPVIERLTDDRRVAPADLGETLELCLVDRP